MLKRIALSILVAGLIAFLFGVVPAHAFSLSKLLGNPDEQKFDTFKLIHVADLKAMMSDSKSPVSVYDANGEGTRSKFGVIPGAKLLDSDQNYDLAVLPADKDSRIVFYCANTHWMASHEAARRAVKAGYKDVFVMVDGIAGWKAEGQPTVSTAGSAADNS